MSQTKPIMTGSAQPALNTASARGPIQALVLSALVVVSAVLCFLFIDKKPFWFDEAFSVEIARFSWHNFAGLLWKREGNMALYYLLLRGWVHFGSSPFFLRSLSVLPAAGSVPVVYWLGRRLYDSRVGLIAAALLTCNAYLVRYAQEARSYSLFIFVATLSSAFFAQYVQRPSTGNRVGHILASGLAVYAHFYAGLLIIAQWLSLQFLRRDEIPAGTNRNWRWIALLVSPAVIFVAKTGASPLHWIPHPGLKDLYEFAQHLTGNDGVVLVVAYAAAIIAALSLSQWRDWRARWDSWRVRFLLLWLLFPVVFTLAVSIVRPLFMSRYFVFCLPTLGLLAAAGLSRLPRNWLLIPVLGLFLALSLKGTLSYYRQDFDLNRDDWAGVSDYVLEHSQPGDALIFHVAMGRMPYQFYESLAPKRATAPVIVFPGRGDALDFHQLLSKPTPELLQTAALEYRRVWVILMNNGTRSNPDATTRLLNDIFEKTYPAPEEHDFFPAIDVRLYSRN